MFVKRRRPRKLPPVAIRHMWSDISFESWLTFSYARKWLLRALMKRSSPLDGSGVVSAVCGSTRRRIKRSNRVLAAPGEPMGFRIG